MLKRLRDALTRNRELRNDTLLERDEDYWDVVQPQRQRAIERAQADCPGGFNDWDAGIYIECPGHLGVYCTRSND